MIEEIKLLLPLLQQATNAAVLLVWAVIIKNIALSIFFGVLFYLAGLHVIRFFSSQSNATRLVTAIYRKAHPHSAHLYYLTDDRVMEIEQILRESKVIE